MRKIARAGQGAHADFRRGHPEALFGNRVQLPANVPKEHLTVGVQVEIELALKCNLGHARHGHHFVQRHCGRDRAPGGEGRHEAMAVVFGSNEIPRKNGGPFDFKKDPPGTTVSWGMLGST